MRRAEHHHPVAHGVFEALIGGTALAAIIATGIFLSSMIASNYGPQLSQMSGPAIHRGL